MNNQYLNDPTPGVQHNLPNPSWHHITAEDLMQPDRRSALFQDALQHGILRDCEPDRLTFFAAIARTLRLKPILANLGGFLRKLVETPAYHAHIAQIDEDTALSWLRDARSSGTPDLPVETWSQGELSKDALTVRELKRDLEAAVAHVPSGHTLFRLVQRHGFLSDWTRERWEQAEMELAQSRLWPRAP